MRCIAELDKVVSCCAIKVPNLHFHCKYMSTYTCLTLYCSSPSTNDLHHRYLKMGRSRSLFHYFHRFNTVDSKQMFNMNFRRWQDSNFRPWCQNRLLYLLSHNQCPCLFNFGLMTKIFLDKERTHFVIQTCPLNDWCIFDQPFWNGTFSVSVNTDSA